MKVIWYDKIHSHVLRKDDFKDDLIKNVIRKIVYVKRFATRVYLIANRYDPFIRFIDYKTDTYM